MKYFGNEYWNKATDNSNKTIIPVQSKDVPNLISLMDKVGLNYYGYSQDNLSKIAINTSDLDTFRKIVGDRIADSIHYQQPKVPYAPPEKNIIGNSEYRYIPNKKYFQADTDTILKMAEIMEHNGIKFSGRIYGEKSKLTVSSNDLSKLSEIENDVNEMRKGSILSFSSDYAVQVDKIFYEVADNKSSIAKPKEKSFKVGELDETQIDKKEYYRPFLTYDRFKEIKAFLDLQIKYSAVVEDNTLTFCSGAEQMPQLVNALRIAENQYNITVELIDKGLTDEQLLVLLPATKTAAENGETSLSAWVNEHDTTYDLAKLVDYLCKYYSLSEIDRIQDKDNIASMLSEHRKFMDNEITLNNIFNDHNYTDEQKSLIRNGFKNGLSDVMLNEIDDNFTSDEIKTYFDKYNKAVSGGIAVSDVTDYLNNVRLFHEGVIDDPTEPLQEVKTENYEGLLGIDKLTHNGSSIYWKYFNPDGNDGNGQFIELTITEYDIQEAAVAMEAAGGRTESGYKAFIDYIDQNCNQTNSTEDFEAEKDNFLNDKYDLTVSQNDSEYHQKIADYMVNTMYLNKAINLINDFCVDEYNSEADLSDLSKVALAYTTTEDEEHEINVYADLEAFTIEYQLDKTVYKTERYADIKDMIENGLTGLDFDEMVALSEDEEAFLLDDIPANMSKSVLAWDEIEDMGYILFEEGYTERRNPSEKALYGNNLKETELFDLANRMRNGEDIRAELAKKLIGRQDYFRTRNDDEFTTTEDGDKLVARYRDVVREISYVELGEAYLKLIENEYNDIIHDRTIEELRYVLKDLSEEQAEELIRVFDNNIMDGWKSGDDQIKINHIKRALYNKLGNDEDKTEKAFAAIADMKYNVKFESVEPEKSDEHDIVWEPVTDTADDNGKVDVFSTNVNGTIFWIEPTETGYAITMVYGDGSIRPISEDYSDFESRWAAEDYFYEDFDNIKKIANSMSEARKEKVDTSINFSENKDHYRIYQLPAGKKYYGIRFMSKETLANDGIELTQDDYELVYEGNWNDISGSSAEMKLQNIYSKFNLEHPEDFKGHSLSVSDVITVGNSSIETAYYVDSFDFKEMPEFFLSKLELLNDNEIIQDILRHDQFFLKKKEDIQSFFANNMDPNDRLEYVKTIFNNDYSEMLLNNDEDNRYGYKQEDQGLHIWKGSYLSRTMETHLTWDTIQSIYAEMVEDNILLDTVVSEIDEPKIEEKTYTEPVEKVDTPEGAEQLSFFGDSEPLDQKKKSKEKKQELLNVDPTIKAISNDMIYYVLRCGSPERGSLSRIVAQYQKGKSDEDNAEFLRKEFGNDGRGYIFNSPELDKDVHISSWFDDFGIKITLGDNVDENLVPNSKIPWLIAARRINDLLENGEYCSQDIIDSAAEREIKDIADRLWYLHQDTDKEVYQYFIPEEMFNGGFPDSTERIRNALHDKDTLQSYIDGLTQLVNDYEQNRDILRFHFHRPKELLYRLKDLQLERRQFTTKPDFIFKRTYFISEREKDALLGYGSGFSDGKFRIEKYFKDNHNSPEQIKFLKNEYGTGGGSKRGGDEWHDAKGITYARGKTIGSPDCKITMKWNEVASRIDRLVSEGKYITQKDIDDKIHDSKRIVQDYDINTYEDWEKEYETQRYTAAVEFLREQGIDINATRSEEQKPEPESVAPVKEQSATNMGENFTITDDTLGEGGAKTKFKNNIAAIKTLKKIESANVKLAADMFLPRPATDEEKEIMSKYVGWGGLSNAFNPENEKWKNEYSELKELLTESEYISARSSVLDSFYTSPLIIDSIYAALEKMGFEGGNILEPACGVGNFLGRLPENIAKSSKVYATEIDSISGRIAQKLYPNAEIKIEGFEKNKYQEGCFDVAVGNVPFGDLSFRDNKYNTSKLHDYFFLESLDKVKNGGIVAFVTSSGTLDKADESIRRKLSEKADLLGAIRLPNTAFKANAGTEVTADIIFLQKNTNRPVISDMTIPDWVHIGQTEDGLSINKYFEQHPEMVLGKMVAGNKLYGREDDTMCVPIEGADLKELLDNAVNSLSGQISDVKAASVYPEKKPGEITPPDDLRNYSLFEYENKIYFKTAEDVFDFRYDKTNKQHKKAKAFIELRDSTRELLTAQEENRSDDVIKGLQAKLNELYDEFYAKYGLINSAANKKAFREDISYNLVATLEKEFAEDKLISKSDIFTKRTIMPAKAIDHVESPTEALALSMAEKAVVDFEYMEKLTDKTKEQLISELKGEIFEIPFSDGQYQTASEYLSGDIRQKLRTAKSAASTDSKFNENIAALGAALPEPLKAGDIDVKIGATWVDPKYYEQFMYETFGTPYDKRSDTTSKSFWRKPQKIEVEYSKYTNQYNITNKRADRSVSVSKTYGTDKINAYEIMECLLNLKDPKITKVITDDNGKEKRVVDIEATKIAQKKADKIRSAFKDWIFDKQERREELVKIYNELFNSIRPREYDGSHLRFPQMNSDITMQEHQKNAIAHALFGGNTLFAHSVGAGKTFEMIAAAMESKRLGLCTKSLMCVPNHLTEQIGADFMKLYPSANILVATKNDFTKNNRQQLFSKIATGNYDAVIIGHSQLKMIPMDKERQENLLVKQINDIAEGIQSYKSKYEDKDFNVKAMERIKKGLEKALEELRAKKQDDVITFEEMGIDKLIVDEAHEFKNLFTATKMQNVSGISSSASQKSLDLFMKCQYLDEKTGGKGIILATGTPYASPYQH